MDNTEKALLLIGGAAVIYFAFLRHPQAQAQAVPVTAEEYDVMSLRHEIWAQVSMGQVDPAVISAIMEVESGGNPNVADGAAGEIGVMQIMPATAMQYCAMPIEALRDPLINISCAVKYLKDIAPLFEGDIIATIAAYNAGPGSVTSQDDRYIIVNQGYVDKVYPLIPRYYELWMQTEYADQYATLFAARFFGVEPCSGCGGKS